MMRRFHSISREIEASLPNANQISDLNKGTQTPNPTPNVIETQTPKLTQNVIETQTESPSTINSSTQISIPQDNKQTQTDGIFTLRKCEKCEGLFYGMSYLIKHKKQFHPRILKKEKKLRQKPL